MTVTVPKFLQLILIVILVKSQNVTEYVESFSDELEAITCNDAAVGGDKCDNKVYGIQDFIDSFEPYFNSGIEDASDLATSVIDRLDSKLNLYASFLQSMASVIQSKCLQHAYDNADTESLWDISDLYFSGNTERDANLPPDMEYNAVYQDTISLSASTYRIPNGMDYGNEYVEKDIKISQTLDATMIELYYTHCYNDEGDDEYCSFYFGTINGVFRQYPGTENSKTSGDDYDDYDPRFRPWYVSAASGGQDVIILLDLCPAMLDDGRLNIAKKAIKIILTSMGTGSFLSVVGFSDFYNKFSESSSGDFYTHSNLHYSCFKDKLVPATARNTELLLEFVENLGTDGDYSHDHCTPNYQLAFDTAFDILYKSCRVSNDGKVINCHQSILLFTASNWEEGNDPHDVISRKNPDNKVVIFSYTLGEQEDHEYVEGAAEMTNGIYTHIDNDNNLVTKMNSFFLYYSYGVPETNIIVTAPYLDYDTGIVMITMAMSVYINQTYFVGVVGTDIPLTILSDAVGDITIGHKSYSFIMNGQSELLSHPLISDASHFFDDESSKYKPILVTDAEPDAFSQYVLDSMLEREYGAIKINAEIRQPTGTGAGYIIDIENLLYIYSGVGPSSLMIAVVIYSDSDFDAPYIPSFGIDKSLNISNCKENGSVTDIYNCLAPFNLYHRLDLMLNCSTSWNDKAQIVNGSELNVGDKYYNEFYSNNIIYSMEYPIYYLQAGLYESEIDALNTDPTCDELQEMHNLANRLKSDVIMDDLPFDGIRNETSSNIINTIYTLTSLHRFWKDTFLADNSPVVSTYFGHYTGIHISYPGKIFRSSYSPLIRPWYQMALAYPDLFVWTTPYRHAVTNKLVTGASTVILSPSIQYTEIFGVLGFDYEYSEFVTYWKTAMGDICDKTINQYCYLIDSSAYLLYYDGMEYDVEDEDISYKFFGNFEPTIMQSLLERNFFKTLTNKNFKGSTIDLVYIVDEFVYLNGNFPDTPTSFAYNTGRYTVHNILKTNLYLIYIENYDLGTNIIPRNCPFNELCSLVKSPGCLKEDEIEKIFIFKHTTESTSKCKTSSVNVCIKPESVILIEKDEGKCSLSISDVCQSNINLLQNNQQSDICATNFVRTSCDHDSATNIYLFYINLFILCFQVILF